MTPKMKIVKDTNGRRETGKCHKHRSKTQSELGPKEMCIAHGVGYNQAQRYENKYANKYFNW